MIAQFNYTYGKDLYKKISSFLMSQGWQTAASVFPNATVLEPDALIKRGICIARDGVLCGIANSKTSSCDTLILRLFSPSCDEKAYTYEATHVPGCGPICNVHQEEEIYSYLGHIIAGVGVITESGGTAYVNYSEKDIISCVISLKMVVDKVEIWQHIAFGEIKKATAFEGGSYLSATRSAFAIYPQEYTAGCIDATSAPIFGVSRYGNTCVYANIEGATDDINKHTTRFPMSCRPMKAVKRVISVDNGSKDEAWFCNWGTGKALATSITDIGYYGDTPDVPNYNYIKSNKPSDANRFLNKVDCISINFPIEIYVQRDPIELDNYSHIGSFPHVMAVSIKNMADCSIHTLSNYDGTEKDKYQIFPHSVRCGRHGYDGIAVLYDTTDYGNS